MSYGVTFEVFEIKIRLADRMVQLHVRYKVGMSFCGNKLDRLRNILFIYSNKHNYWKNWYLRQKTLTLRGSNGIVQLTSCLFCLDSAALLMLNEQQFYLFGQMQTSQTGRSAIQWYFPLWWVFSAYWHFPHWSKFAKLTWFILTYNWENITMGNCQCEAMSFYSNIGRNVIWWKCQCGKWRSTKDLFDRPPVFWSTAYGLGTNVSGKICPTVVR